MLCSHLESEYEKSNEGATEWDDSVECHDGLGCFSISYLGNYILVFALKGCLIEPLT
jgi:hypothetical protein